MNSVMVRIRLPLLIVLAVPVLVQVYHIADTGRPTVAALGVIAAVLVGALLVSATLLVARWQRRVAPPQDAVVPGGLARASTAARREYVAPSELPPPPGFLFGRDDEIMQIRSYLQSGRQPLLVAVGGAANTAAGVGRSALTIGAAHVAAGRFPDGQLMIRFGTGATTTVEDALAMLFTGLKRPGEDMPDRSALHRWYQQRTANVRILLILDDVDDAGLVTSLLPTGPGCACMVTLRSAVTGLPDRLDIRLKPLDQKHRMEAFRTLVGAERVDIESAAARTIVEATRGYPVAIKIAAAALARRTNWTLAAIAERMADDPLQPLGDVELPPYSQIIDLAYSLLTTREQEALRLLGLLEPGSCQRLAPWMLADVLAKETRAEVDDTTAGRLLDRLAQLQLTERRFDDRSGTLRYHVPEYLHAYAQVRYRHHRRISASELRIRRRRTDSELARVRRERDLRSRERLLRNTVYIYLHAGMLSKALDTAREASDLTREGVGADTPDAGERLAWAALAEVYAELGWIDNGITEATAAIEGQDRDTHPLTPSRPRALRVLGTLHRRLRQLATAESYLDAARSAVRDIEDRGEEIRVLRELAVVQALSDVPGRGRETVAEAIRLCDTTGVSGERARPSVLWAHGWVLSACGEFEAADRVLGEADRLAKNPNRGSPLWAAWIRHQRALAALQRGNYSYGIELGLCALESFTAMGHRYGAAHCRLALGRGYRAYGNLRSANSMLEEAHSTLLRCGDRWIEADAALELARVYYHELYSPPEAAWPTSAGKRERLEREAIALLAAAEQAFLKLGDTERRDRASYLLWQVEAGPQLLDAHDHEEEFVY